MPEVSHVNFAEANGGTIHNINVSIKNATDNTVIYSKPDNAHAHQDGTYEHHDDVILSSDNGVEGHSDWILEAKVWGHDETEADATSSSVTFHLHP